MSYVSLWATIPHKCILPSCPQRAGYEPISLETMIGEHRDREKRFGEFAMILFLDPNGTMPLFVEKQRKEIRS